MTDPDARRKLQDIYDDMPTINCQGLCWNACGPIEMSTTERSSVADLGVTIPVATPEWVDAWHANEPVYCPAFSLGAQGVGKPGCTAYEARPYICRAWGVVDADEMRCPHGCTTSRMLTPTESVVLYLRTLEVGGHEQLSGTRLKAIMDLVEQADDHLAGLIARLLGGDTSVQPELTQMLAKNGLI